jgi:tetratricopeptide (TPR) repeat protein
VPSRIAKFLITYVAGAAGVVQFIDWAVTRYMLSKSLVDLAIFVALLMLPTVLLIAWHSGRANKRVVGVGVPLNLLVAAVVLLVVFHGKKLGATTDVVAVRDDSGALVNRHVPKAEFRKHVALFNCEKSGDDASADWLRQAVPALLAADLAQDQFLDVRDNFNYGFRAPFHRAHLTSDDVVPLAFARQVAEAKHLGFFVTGTVKKEGATYRLHVALNSTQQGHAVSEHDVQGDDLLELIDQLSPLVRRDLGIPTTQIESSPDLPVSEITSRSLPAYAEFVQAMKRSFDDDPVGAMPHFEKAVAIDPAFAMAHLYLFFGYFQSHQVDKTRQEEERVVANVYKLPETQRFYFNATHYLLQGNVDKQHAVLTNWVTLYPESVDARRFLADYYTQRDQRDEALATYAQALAIDPSATSILQSLVELRMARGEYEEAFTLYRRYLERFPNDGDMQVALADQYRQAGRFDEARQWYQRAISIDPENVAAAIGRATVDFARGEYDNAIAALQKLLAQTRLPRDRVAVYNELTRLYLLRGQNGRALEAVTGALTDLGHFSQPALVLHEQLRLTRVYVLAGHVDEARRRVAQAAADTQAVKENVDQRFNSEFSQLELDNALDDAAGLAAHLPSLQATIREFGIEAYHSLELGYEARIKELHHDFAGARAAWHEAERLTPEDTQPAIGVARCQRLLGDLDGARAQLERVLVRFPADPEARYELALTLREHNPDGARAELTRALAIWAPADADYKLAKEARSLATTLAPRAAQAPIKAGTTAITSPSRP